MGKIALDGDAGFADVAQAGFQIAVEAASNRVADGAGEDFGKVDVRLQDVGQGVQDSLAVELALAGE